ncbi:hypothetical protein BsWGS_00188 [Bradybaena similaris]
MKKDYSFMAFSPIKSPVYGGDTMFIHVDPDQLNQKDAKYFVVFEGSRRRHVVSACQPSPSEQYLITYIPGHDIEEDVQVTLVQLLEDTSTLLTLAQSFFRYEYDPTFYLTKFLTSSVYNNHALDNLELIKSDRFDISNEVLSTLDFRLSRSLRNSNLATTWHLLGGDSINDAHCEERETLLHFCARLGLKQVAQYLLEQPGKEDALLLPNRHGELPHSVARQKGFHDLAEMLTGYNNTHGVAASQQEAVELDSAVLRSYGNGTASLTSFLDSPTLERTVENEIIFLKETEEMMKVQRGFHPERIFNSDWSSSNSNLQHNTGASRSLPTLPLDQEVRESLDRLLTQQILHRKHIQSFLRTSSLPISDGACSHSSNSFDEGNASGSNGDIGSSGNVTGAVQQQQLPPARPTSLRPGVTGRECVPTHPAQSCSIYEYSLSGLQDLTESLFQLRDLQLHYRLSREVRKRHFSRFSSSCPSLSEPAQCLTLTPIDGGEHHKSMHDLVDVLGRQSPRRLQAGADTDQQGLLSTSTTSQSPHQEGSFDQGIRICINGVTVDSSEDFPAVSGSPSQTSKDTGAHSNRKCSRVKNETDQFDTSAGRGSRSYAGSDSRSSLPLDRRDQQTRVRMLAMTGKSLSLTSLDGEEESEDEDFVDSAKEEHPRAIVMPRFAHSFAVGKDTDVRSDSPVDSSGSSPSHDNAVPGIANQNKIGSDLSLSSQNARSLTDLSFIAESPKTPLKERISLGSPGGPKLGTHHSFEYTGGLTVSHSNMTKSLSTPSIPQATEASGDRAHALQDRREVKHKEDNQFYPQKYFEDYDAQFRRQKEIEEEEEDEDSVSVKDNKAEISWKDFINEELSPNDSDDKNTKAFSKKEDKKRKQSVFSRIHSSYRTKKNKEKESKQKERHHFVAISFSNATACDVCHKPMANKAALRCENCLVNVHEHNCKDQITQCDKNRNKALHREGAPHGSHGPQQSIPGALLERQPASVTGTSLRPSQSFKDKRSASAPVKTQPNQLSTPAQLSHRHSLPTSSKAISEESEADTMSVATVDVVGQSNMTDTISESLESLDAVVPSEISWLDDEPDLQLAIDEPEAWSITVDRKTLKKLSTKDIKRQDTIWELINTEKQYVKRLKIMQKIFAASMLRDMNFTEDQVDRLFPRLDELVELHANFLRQLLTRQARNEDRSVDDVGDVLVDQFQDSTAEKMKSVYGVFCSRHTEAMQLYKDLIKDNRKFQTFAKKCTNLPVCEKRDISDFILGVTVRLSKYPILIEAILKSTKDKKDRENLSHALLLSKDVVQNIDEKVASYEKLMDIHSKMDSRAVTFKDKKFKRQDLLSDTRELVYSGNIGWKSARGRVYDVLAVVLTDLIVFLQKNEQKYTFLMQDNKSCVIPLHNLLVREKRDAKDSLGIYMISQNRKTPEMYELVCQSKAEREEWIKILQDAIRACPADVEPELWPPTNPGVALSNEEDKRRKEEHANKVKVIIEQLHQKDEAIRECCDDKSKLMFELMQLSTPRNEAGSRPNSQEIVNFNESVEIVHAAMQEASHLTTILQGSGTQLSRSVSSVGEHHSNTFIATPVPKRAETFAGFDSSHDSPKINAMKQRFINVGQEDDEARSPSLLSLDQPEGDSSFSDAPEATPTAPKEMNTLEPKTAGGSTQPHPSPLQHGSNAHLWEETANSDKSSDQGSLGELSAASVSSLSHPPTNHEQMTSICHLVQYLNTLMNLTSKQCTKVESLRAELAEAKEEIAKLSADMQGRRSVYRHDQLEELRNLQENISRDRQELEKTKLQDRTWLETEKKKLENERREIEKEKLELRQKKDDLKREREVLQRQIDMMRQQGYQVSSSVSDPSDDTAEPDKLNTNVPPLQRPMSHRRSASADFYNTVAISDIENMNNCPSYAGDAPKGFPRQPRLSVGGNTQGQGSNAGASTKQPVLPVHLLSARNEQRIGGVSVQCLPMKLSGSNSGATGAPPHPPSARGAGVTRVQSMSATSRSALAQQARNNVPSGLAGVMKLADPKPPSGSNAGVLPSSKKTPAPQPGAAPGGPVSKSESDQKVIYF